MSQTSLSGGRPRKALVTGANGGLGRAIVERMRADGFDVVTADVRGPADLVHDLRDPLPPGCVDDIDVCVSNAGLVDVISPAHRMRPEKWDLDLAVNLTGAFRVVQACLPGMRARNYGRVVVVSSVAARVGGEGQVAYAASKAGLIGMTKTIALENAALGITANAVLPGLIATETVLAMPPAVLESAARGLAPATRMGRPEEVAAAVAFLASQEAGYVTGQELAIDGGMLLSSLSVANPARRP